MTVLKEGDLFLAYWRGGGGTQDSFWDDWARFCEARRLPHARAVAVAAYALARIREPWAREASAAALALVPTSAPYPVTKEE